jgi:hypothetical protein
VSSVARAAREHSRLDTIGERAAGETGGETVSEPATDFRRLARTCPDCGGREPTLGTVCPLCGRPYDEELWARRGPINTDDWPEGQGGFILIALAELLNLLLLGLAELLMSPWRLGRRWFKQRRHDHDDG